MPILGIPFKVIYKAKVMDPDSPNEECCGLTIATDRKIYISTTQNKTKEAILSTLIHEIQHAILGVAGHSCSMKEEGEEGIVTCLENGWTPIVSSGVLNW